MAKEYVEERNGGYYLAGTRISLDSTVQCFNEGLSPETIVEEFETLTLAQAFGAIALDMPEAAWRSVILSADKRLCEVAEACGCPAIDPAQPGLFRG